MSCLGQLVDQWLMAVLPKEWSWIQLPPQLTCSDIPQISRMPGQIGGIQSLGCLYTDLDGASKYGGI